MTQSKCMYVNVLDDYIGPPSEGGLARGLTRRR